ncbi:MAG TPA: hypothetical protein VF167_15980 [Longimicrobiaceae bacterium]
MSNLSRSLTGASFAMMLVLGSAAVAAGQEPAPLPDPQPPVEAPPDAQAPDPLGDPPPAEAPDPLANPPQAPEAPEAPADQTQQAPITLQLSAVGGAQGSGEATLSPNGEETGAVVNVQGLSPSTQYSAFLLTGTCEQPGDVMAPLGTIEADDQGSGSTEVRLTAPLDSIVAAGATVQIHPQGDAPTQALLCGAVQADGGAAF